MYATYGNIYHQYIPNVSIYAIHGSYGWFWFNNPCFPVVQSPWHGSDEADLRKVSGSLCRMVRYEEHRPEGESMGCSRVASGGKKWIEFVLLRMIWGWGFFMASRHVFLRSQSLRTQKWMGWQPDTPVTWISSGLQYLRGSWNCSRGSTAEGLAEESILSPFAEAPRKRLCTIKIMMGCAENIPLKTDRRGSSTEVPAIAHLTAETKTQAAEEWRKLWLKWDSTSCGRQWQAVLLCYNYSQKHIKTRGFKEHTKKIKKELCYIYIMFKIVQL